MAPIHELIADPRNARTHTPEQVGQLAAAIAEFGFTNPILIRTNRVIIAGHARLLAARQLDRCEVPVIEVDGLSEAKYRALAIADNQIPLNAGWDYDLLRHEIAALEQEDFNMDLLAFSDEELSALLAAEERSEDSKDEDAAPDPPVVAVSILGDLWDLDGHRLLVGDATIGENVIRLMGGDGADLGIADPPYNVGYAGYTKDRLTICGDQMTAEEFQRFLTAGFQSYRTAVKNVASLYVFHSSSWQRQFQDTLESAGFEVRCQLVWAKNTFAWGHGRYKFRHEPIYYAHVRGEKDLWYGDKTQSTLWEVDKPSANRLHPTMKPVQLIERALINSSRAGDVVVDLFAGSGSTLLACERRKRRARLMEIDPKYADVVVRRWQEYCGKVATLEEDGRSFAEVSQQRQVREMEAAA